MQATIGSTIKLECTASGSFYQWQRLLGSYWSNAFQESSKYRNVNTAFLTIYTIDVNDAGNYRCTATGSGTQQSLISLTVTGICLEYVFHIWKY